MASNLILYISYIMVITKTYSKFIKLLGEHSQPTVDLSGITDIVLLAHRKMISLGLYTEFSSKN